MTVIKTLDECFGEKMQESMDYCFTEMMQSICPIYGANNRGNPDHIGSCSLLKIAGKFFILTAAHVIDKNEFSTLYIGLGNNEELIELNGEFLLTERVNEDRNKDKFDFAWSELNNTSKTKLNSKKFIQIDITKCRSDSTIGRLFMPIGFPNSKNKKFNAHEKLIKTQALKYSSVVEENNNKYIDNELSKETHLLLDYQKYSNDSDNNKTLSPNPTGISGGLVVDIGSHSNPDNFRPEAQNHCRPVGLLIENLDNQPFIVATKLDLIVKTICGNFEK